MQWGKCDKSVDLLFHILLVQRNPIVDASLYLGLAANLELDTVPLGGFDLDEGRVACEKSWESVSRC